MRCPHCGEPLQSKHSFCVICGGDLLNARPENPVRNAVSQIQSVLTAPVIPHRQAAASAIPAAAAKSPFHNSEK